MQKYYTGVGSRETPEHILPIMTELAYQLERKGWILRSGGAWGADEAFQRGVKNYSNIFLPYKHFRKAEGITGTYLDDRQLVAEAMYIMSKHKGHPQWDNWLNNASQLSNVKLHTRNVFQVLGSDLKTPSKFLVCYTRDGACTYDETSYASGGTGTAIRLASIFGVEVFNLKREDHLLRITTWIEEMKNEEALKLQNFLEQKKEPEVKNNSRYRLK